VRASRALLALLARPASQVMLESLVFRATPDHRVKQVSQAQLVNLDLLVLLVTQEPKVDLVFHPRPTWRLTRML